MSGSMDMERVKLEQKVHTLQFQNQKLSAQLEVQRKAGNELQNRLEGLEERQADYSDTLLTVDRLWQELNHDIGFLAQRAGQSNPVQANGAAAATAATAHDSTSNGEAPTVAAAAVESISAPGEKPDSDPFLRTLLRNSDPKTLRAFAAKEAELDDGATEVERALRKRSNASKAALSSLLRHMDAERLRADSRVTQSFATSSPEAAEELQKLQSECAMAFGKADAQVALARATAVQLAQSEAAVQRADARVTELTNELADREEELSAAQRKLVMARSNSTLDPAGTSQALQSLASLALPVTPLMLLKKSSSMIENSADVNDVTLQLSDLRKTLESRTTELDAEKEAVMKLQREVAKLQQLELDEATILASLQFKQKAEEAARREAEAVQLRLELAQSKVMVDQLAAQTAQLPTKEFQIRQHRMQLEEAQKRVRELDAELLVARNATAEAERKGQAAFQARGSETTVAELKVMLGSMQGQRAALLREVEREKAAAVCRAELSSQAAAAQSSLQVKELQLQRMEARAETADARVVTLTAASTQLRATAADLRLFVDVLQSVAPESQSLAELKASEARLIRDVQRARAQLEGSALSAAKEEAATAAQEAAAKLTTLLGERDVALVKAAAAERQVADSQRDLESAQGDSECYISEIEATGAAFEEMQGQNARLLAQITQREETQALLSSERLKAMLHAQQVTLELEDAARRMTAAEATTRLHQERSTDLELRLQAAQQDALAARELMRQSEARAEAAARESAETDATLAVKAAALETAAAAAVDRKRVAEDEGDKAQRERIKRQRLENENKSMQSRLERLQKAGTGGVEEELKEEVDAMRTLLRCSVCRVRQKDAIITKCWHMFCQPCIKSNLDTRHRKCPGCGVGFGAADVKQVFMT